MLLLLVKSCRNHFLVTLGSKIVLKALVPFIMFSDDGMQSNSHKTLPPKFAFDYYLAGVVLIAAMVGWILVSVLKSEGSYSMWYGLFRQMHLKWYNHFPTNLYSVP